MFFPTEVLVETGSSQCSTRRRHLSECVVASFASFSFGRRADLLFLLVIVGIVVAFADTLQQRSLSPDRLVLFLKLSSWHLTIYRPQITISHKQAQISAETIKPDGTLTSYDDAVPASGTFTCT